MIHLDQVQKSYGRLPVLQSCNGLVPMGSFAAVHGRSGCGKSTLLLIIGGLLQADAGEVVVAGQNMAELPSRDRERFRAESIGFVFQRFHLLPYFTVAENICASSLAWGWDDPVRLQELLEHFGLDERRDHRPGQLSVGEQQRCALARALYHRPRVLLADEPTGNLDHENASIVLDTFAAFAEGGGTVLMVSHDDRATARADRCFLLQDGQLQEPETAAVKPAVE
jgi:putative ABC transport system ATP-binding protein